MKIIPFQMSQSSRPGYQRANITDESIIMGIINHDEAAIGAVYREYHQKIKKMVYTFRNTTLEPDDIFQEGLTRAIINIREGRFRGESSFMTYLNSICRNICLKELSRKQTDPIGTRDIPVDNNPIDFEALDQLLKIRNQLDEKCRSIAARRVQCSPIILREDGTQSRIHVPFRQSLWIRWTRIFYRWGNIGPTQSTYFPIQGIQL